MKTIKPDYENSILGIPSSLLKYYGLNHNYPSIKELDDVLQASKKNIVYIILDGMGINIMNNCLNKDSFFNKHLIKKITTVFPSTTVCATTALHSGLSGYESGWIGWHLYFKEYKESVELFLNQTYYTKKFVDVSKKISYENIYDKIINSHPEMMYSKIFPVKAGGEYKTFDEMCSAVKQVCSNNNKNLISFYYNEPDHTLHRKGTKSDEIKTIVNEIENKLEQLYNSLNDTTFIITADHGHTDVEIINTYEDKTLINFFSYPPTGEFRLIQFHIKKDMNENFQDYFNEKYGKDFLLLSKKDFINSKLLGLHKKNKNLDNFIGDYVAIAINNKSLIYSTDEMKSQIFLADHAGLTEDEMLVPLIIVSK